MSRPQKYRRVAFMPEVTYFKPAGIPLRFLNKIRLSLDEAEAIRLKDLEGSDQEKCAEKMNISRATFQRVLVSAHQKIADALVNGKAIEIRGGNIEMTLRRFRCNYGHEWNVPLGKIVSKLTESCPTCNTEDITPVEFSQSGGNKGNVNDHYRTRHRQRRNRY